MQKLDIDKFKVWLESFSPDDIVGWPRTSTHCPLTFFLTKKFGGGVNMGPAIVMLNGKRLDVDTEDWANDFMKYIDSLFPRFRVVTAGQCLDWLNQTIEVEND